MRERQKEQRMNTAKSFRNKQDEFELLLKSKKGNMYLQLIEEVKQASAAKNFDEEVDSDDQDQEENM